MPELLKPLRDQIDAIDAELLKLVNQRAALAQKIGDIKRKNNNIIVAYRPEREAQILTHIEKQNPGPLSNAHIQRLFTEIMSMCRALEHSIRIAYLGPSGTFSEDAVLKKFGHAVTLVPCDSIDDVFRAVEFESADYGVVPVENSTEGAVGRSMDLLLMSPLLICGEVQLPIHQSLMSQDIDLKDIKKVYSHPQSLAQSQQWLRLNLPQLSSSAYIHTNSNSEAARLVATDSFAAAVGNKRAAELFGLTVRAESIEDDPRNTTRFLVLGRQFVDPSGKDKTSLALMTHNRSGAIYHILEPLAKHNVSMSRLESRPLRTGLWQYVFFIDLEGHEQDANVTTALDEIRQKAAFLKIFGSYPVS